MLPQKLSAATTRMVRELDADPEGVLSLVAPHAAVPAVTQTAVTARRSARHLATMDPSRHDT
jgi:hypothetical protein